MKPIAYDLYCGLGGWSEGFLAEGYECIGFDIEAHDYGTGGYPGTLILRDIRSIHGFELKDATVIVASPPCQAYSYRAMPWKKAKALPPPDNTLFNECFRIQREASQAAGHHIPLIVENVRGAQKWVGRAAWHYGSFYLWGDVPALMPMTAQIAKIPNFRFDGSGRSFQSASVEMYGLKMGWDNSEPGKCRRVDGQKVVGEEPVLAGEFAWNKREKFQAMRREGIKVPSESGRRSDVGKGARFTSRDCGIEANGIKVPGMNWSDRNSRKAASAMIAKIPFPLSSHIAKCFKGAL